MVHICICELPEFRWLLVVARKELNGITHLKNMKGQRRQLGAGELEAG